MLLLPALTALLLTTISTRAAITVTLQQLKDETIRAVVTNTDSKQDVKLLRDPTSVLRDGSTHKFEFKSVGGSVVPKFKGIKVSWDPDDARQNPQAYVTIPAGKSVNFDNDLLKTYKFSGKGSQKFTISLPHSFFLTRDSKVSFPAPSLTITVTVKSLHLLPAAQHPLTATVADSTNVRPCTGTELNTLRNAGQSAIALAQESFRYLSAVHPPPPPVGARYTTWFGAYDEGRHVAAAGIFSNVARMPFGNWVCDGSDCQPGEYAYVFSVDTATHTIYLCNAFWGRPLVGTNSKPGVLVHEVTHFDDMGGTEDHAYGKPDCQTLARYDPDAAVSNADSFKFFAENSPALP